MSGVSGVRVQSMSLSTRVAHYVHCKTFCNALTISIKSVLLYNTLTTSTKSALLYNTLTTSIKSTLLNNTHGGGQSIIQKCTLDGGD
jgi:hypothetical protein